MSMPRQEIVWFSRMGVRTVQSSRIYRHNRSQYNAADPQFGYLLIATSYYNPAFLLDAKRLHVEIGCAGRP